jgi:hypothetical protein
VHGVTAKTLAVDTVIAKNVPIEAVIMPALLI